MLAFGRSIPDEQSSRSLTGRIVPTLLQIEFHDGLKSDLEDGIGARENAVTRTNGKVDDMEATGMERKRM